MEQLHGPKNSCFLGNLKLLGSCSDLEYTCNSQKEVACELEELLLASSIHGNPILCIDQEILL